MVPNWDDLKTVLCLVRGGSLAQAASELGVSYTTVARRVSRLEAALGRKLFERLVDGYSATDEGRLIAEHAATMETAEQAMLREMTGRDGTLRGPLTVTAPQLLIAHVLAPMLDRFCTAYPEVELQVRATNDLLDLDRREADLAIRISRNPGDALKGLRLAEQHSASFATQAWADRIAAHPCGPIDWIVYSQHASLPKGVTERFPGARIRIRFDDMLAMQGAAQAGLGVVRMPMFLGRATPGLVQVPVLPPQPYPEVWVVGHPDVWPSAKVAAFREELVQFVRARRVVFTA